MDYRFQIQPGPWIMSSARCIRRIAQDRDLPLTYATTRLEIDESDQPEEYDRRYKPKWFLVLEYPDTRDAVLARLSDNGAWSDCRFVMTELSAAD